MPPRRCRLDRDSGCRASAMRRCQRHRRRYRETKPGRSLTGIAPKTCMASHLPVAAQHIAPPDRSRRALRYRPRHSQNHSRHIGPVCCRCPDPSSRSLESRIAHRRWLRMQSGCAWDRRSGMRSRGSLRLELRRHCRSDTPCVFRSHLNADSDGTRAPIPMALERSFRRT